MIYIISELIGSRFPKYQQTIMLCSAAIMSIPSLLSVSDIWMQEVIHNYYYTYSLIFGVALTAILFVITYFPQRRGGIS
ncbi:hypothetical protein D3C73_1288930 [compost metagenome]